MHQLKQIDEVEIFVLMDNVADPFSKNSTGVYWNEFQDRFGVRKQSQLCGADCCRACNGLSLFIRVKVGERVNTLLFDTGPDAGLIVENADRLGLDLSEVEAIVLSHGHFDHFGGTVSALKAINKSNLPVYVHPELFLPRAFGEDGNIRSSYNLTKEEIEKHGGNVIESTTPTSLFAETLLISGEVPRTTNYEQGMPDEFRLDNDTWRNSPDIIDEQCLIMNFKNRGLGVITGCGHTGIINATKHATTLLNSTEVHLVMGGFHLASPELADRIDPTIADLQTIDPTFIVSGHCTGRQTQAKLSQVFTDQHIPYGVGARFVF